MAVIGKIREKSTLVLIIIGGAILAFVFTDLFSSQSGGQQGPINLAEVDGSTISPQEFDFKVQQRYEQFQTQSPETELDEATKSNLREQVWNEVLSDVLLNKRMEKIGIDVTTKELFDMVQGKDPHPQVLQAFSDPQTGQFNSNAVIQFLQNLNNDPKAKQQWLEFERALKKNQKYDKYYNLVKKGSYIPAELAKKQFADNNTKLTFKYVFQPYSYIVDSEVELSEADIEEFYNETKNDYEQEASVGIAYAYFPVEPSIKDREIAREWVDNTFEKFKKVENDSTFVNANSDGRFDPQYYSKQFAPANIDTSLWGEEVGFVAEPKQIGEVYYINKVRAKRIAPDSVKGSHILISTQNKAEDVAEALADSLLELINNGTSLEELVLENSDDQAAAKDTGNLGWFTESTIIPIFRPALSAEIGTVTKVQSPSGFHLMKITDKTELKDKIQIATITKAIEPGKETYEDIFNEANSFSIEATDLESFNSLINDKNIQRRGATIAEEESLISGLGASRDMARWAKEANEGEISEAYDVDDAFVVAIVESVNIKGPAPLDKVRNRVEFLARQEKKAEILEKDLAGSTDLGELAGKLGLSVENAVDITFTSPALSGVGLEPNVVAKAMSLQQGQISLPIKGENGVFVIAIENKVMQGQENIAQVREINRRTLATRVDNGALFNAIKEGTELIDNRSKFY